MGQLERYGLYVLCVVIVLILGVAIWGGDPAMAGTADDDLDRLLEASAAPAGPAPGAGGAAGHDYFDVVKPLPPPPSSEPSNDLSAEDELEGVVFVDGSKTASPPPAPESGSAADPAPTHALRTYRVQPNDTMEGIARSVLGDRRHVKALRDLNPGVDPKRMRPGTELKLPAGGAPDTGTAKAGTGAAQGSGWREYQVRKGDSASEISKKMYGTTRHAKKILEVNGISDPTKLQLDTVLRIPPVE
jgi:nucleoid-associated protein YgaU